MMGVGNMVLLLALAVITGCRTRVLATGDDSGPPANKDWKPVHFTDQQGAQPAFADIWGSGPDDIYVTGGNSYHSSDRGLTWTPVSVNGDTTATKRIWGSGKNDIYVTNQGGVYHSTDGATWTPMGLGILVDVNDVWGSSAHDVWVVGGGVYHSDGQSDFTDRGIVGPPELQGVTFGIGGSGPHDVFVTNVDGSILHGSAAGTTSTWTLSRPTDTGALNGFLDAWLDGPGNVFVVGDSGRILHSADDGATWQPQSSGTTETLFSVWGSASNDVYVVGLHGTILHTQDRGAQWQLEAAPTSEDLGAIWGASADLVFIVGANGTLLRKVPSSP